MKRQKKDKRRQSTQQLMGVKKITDYCISTDAGDLVFYIIKPTNISVLPAGAVSAKIRALQNTLSAQAGVAGDELQRELQRNLSLLPRPNAGGKEPCNPRAARTGPCISG